jgi:predicted acetyltransferase
MAVLLVPVPFTEKAELRALLAPYLVAHADEVDPGRVHGDPTDYPWFDAYWQAPERRPFWILADRARVGFVLVNAHAPSGRGCDQAIAEFCVLPARRRGGIGTAAALAALATAPGVWELQVYRANHEGMAFWPRVVAAASPAEREEIALADRVIHRLRMATPEHARGVRG